jgi:hypothetical protein
MLCKLFVGGLGNITSGLALHLMKCQLVAEQNILVLQYYSQVIGSLGWQENLNFHAYVSYGPM